MKLRRRTVTEIADMICGNEEAGPYFLYRSSSYLTEFFADADTDHVHNGGTRKWWVADVLDEILQNVWPNAMTPPAAFARVIATLMDQADRTGEGETVDRAGALAALNSSLARDGYEAFYAADRICYLRHTGTGTVSNLDANPHRPLTADERERRTVLEAYLDRASEDDLIEDVLLPLFRHLGFERISAAGHRDKALEYGKDVWMRYMLPTRNWLYFGVQVKKGKLDAAGASKGTNANVAEILNQITMMLGHKLFDPDTNRRVLVDHAYIVAGGEITKQARNWLGERLDETKRSQIMFMERSDILDLFVVANVPLPASAQPTPKFALPDDIPF